LDKKLTKVK